MADHITVRVNKIRNSDVELHGRYRITSEGGKDIEWDITPEAAEIIINGYEKDIAALKEINRKLVKELNELRPKQVAGSSIRTGNMFGGGYGD